MNKVVFLDTAYAIALSNPNDQQHRRAVELAEEIESANISLVATHAILIEIGNALSRLRFRQAAIELLAALHEDPRVEIVPVTGHLYARGLELYSSRPDKEWGLTDCISFVVMQERGISEALTGDDHFQQAGFEALLGDR